MKISLLVMIDDKEKIFESTANMGLSEDGKADATATQWMLYGMLTDAIQKIRVAPPEPQQRPSDLSGASPMAGAMQ